MTSNDIYIKLLDMRNTHGAALYQRLTLAKTLLADREWVEDVTKGGGDVSTAIDRLEDECFGDSGMGLPSMLEVLHAVPQAATWKVNKYNIRRMYAEMKVRQESTTPRTQRETPTVVVDRKEQRLIYLQEQVEELTTQLRTLKEENRRLKSALQKIKRDLTGVDADAA